MPTVMLEVPESAQTGDVERVPMSRAQAVLLERAARELELHLASAKGTGLARELRAMSELWRGQHLASSAEGEAVGDVTQLPDLDLEASTP